MTNYETSKLPNYRMYSISNETQWYIYKRGFINEMVNLNKATKFEDVGNCRIPMPCHVHCLCQGTMLPNKYLSLKYSKMKIYQIDEQPFKVDEK